MRFTGTVIFGLFLTLGAVSGASGGQIVITTSDYISGNTAAFDTEISELTDNLLGHYQDAYVRTRGRDVFIIEGGDNSNITKLDRDNLQAPIWQYSVGAGSNPHDLVFVPTQDGLKGYVLRYNDPSLWVVNLDAANAADFKLGEIDLSAWNDADGSPEAHLGYYYDGYVWIVLQRYNLNSFTSETGVLLKIDPSTDTIMDMDSETEGVQGVEFIRKNPVSGSLVDGILYLAGTTYGVSDEGVWSVDLSHPKDGQTVVLSEQSIGENVAGVYVANFSYGVVSTYDDSWNAVPRAFDPSTGVLLDPLPVPDAGGGMTLVNGVLYVGSRDYRNPALYVVDPESNTIVSGPFPLSLPPLTLAYAGEDIADSVEETVPAPFALKMAYPNPFNPSTTIAFTLDRGMRVSLAAYSITGQKVDELANTFFAAGEHAMKWDAPGLSSGVYFIRLSDGTRSQFRRVMLLK